MPLKVLDRILKIVYAEIDYWKPLIGRSTLSEHFQRAAGGVIAVMRRLANGPVRAN
ncbi:MAG: hypothetical protein ACI4AA_05840 [Lachnospiraceae bacterium]